MSRWREATRVEVLAGPGACQAGRGSLCWDLEEITLEEGARTRGWRLEHLSSAQLSWSESKKRHWLHLELRPSRGDRLRLKAPVQAKEKEGLPKLDTGGESIDEVSFYALLQVLTNAGVKLLLDGVEAPGAPRQAPLAKTRSTPLTKPLKLGRSARCSRFTMAWWFGSLILAPLTLMLTFSHPQGFFFLLVGGALAALVSKFKQLPLMPVGVFIVVVSLISSLTRVRGEGGPFYLAGLGVLSLWFLQRAWRFSTDIRGAFDGEGYWFQPLGQPRIEGKWGSGGAANRLKVANGWSLVHKEYELLKLADQCDNAPKKAMALIKKYRSSW